MFSSKNTSAAAEIERPFVTMMRLRNTKRGAPEKAVGDGNVDGQKLNADIINTACCGDVSGNGTKDPIAVSCIDKEDSGKATMEGQFVEDEITPSLDGCFGEGVLTQDDREEENDRKGFIAGEVVGGARGLVPLAGNSLSFGVDDRKGLKRARFFQVGER